MAEIQDEGLRRPDSMKPWNDHDISIGAMILDDGMISVKMLGAPRSVPVRRRRALA